MKFCDLILEMSGKRINRIASDQRNRHLSMVSPIYIVPELTRIVRVVGEHVPIKVRFGFIHESITEMALFSISIPVKLSVPIFFTLALIMSGNVKYAGGNIQGAGECDTV